MKDDTCRACHYWNVWPGGPPAGLMNGYWDVNECRRNAPVLGPEHRWPLVRYYDWCGEFKAASTEDMLARAEVLRKEYWYMNEHGTPGPDNPDPLA